MSLPENELAGPTDFTERTCSPLGAGCDNTVIMIGFGESYKFQVIGRVTGSTSDNLSGLGAGLANRGSRGAALSQNSPRKTPADRRSLSMYYPTVKLVAGRRPP